MLFVRNISVALRLRVVSSRNKPPTVFASTAVLFGLLTALFFLTAGSAFAQTPTDPDVTAPVIIRLGDATVLVGLDTIYNDAGATATDNADGDITSSITATITDSSGTITGIVNTDQTGTYTLTYTVSDAAGNVADTVTRTVTVTEDVTDPVIVLNGTATVSIELGATYTDAGASATDNVDGNITDSITTIITNSSGNEIGEVNTRATGTYTLTYTVYDVAGNTATAVIRTVTVTPDVTAPVITASTNTVTEIAGTAITEITIISTGGAVASYSIRPVLSAGLSLNTATGTISGTPAIRADSITYTITATNVTGMDTTTVTIAVNAAPVTDTAPSFGTATVTAQTYTVDTATTDLTLPVATGGNGSLTYTLSPELPAGLVFDEATRTISGTPTTPLETATYTLTVTDADTNMTASDTATLMFSITVIKAVPSFTLDVDDSGVFDINDALMIVRYTLSIKGANLTASLTKKPYALVVTNIEAGEVTNIEAGESSSDLDVDGSGVFDINDALMIVRYALSIKGANLTASLTNASHETVVGNIEGLIPPTLSGGGVAMATEDDKYQEVYPVMTDSMTKIDTFPGVIGSAEVFTFDLIYDDNLGTRVTVPAGVDEDGFPTPETIATGVSSLIVRVFFDGTVLEYDRNPASAKNISTEDSSHVNPAVNTRSSLEASDSRVDDGNPVTDSFVDFGWANVDGNLFPVSPLRVVSLPFRWKADATKSSTTIYFSYKAKPDDVDVFRGSSLVINGPRIDEVPSVPQNLIATPIFADTIDLAWDAPATKGCRTDAEPCPISYQIERSTSSDFSTPTVLVDFSVTSSVTTLRDDGVALGTYYYRVSAMNGNLTATSTVVTATATVSSPTGITLTAAPATVSESGGTQTVIITATITGGVPNADTITVTLTGTDTFTTGSIKYDTATLSLTALPSITILGRASSGTIDLTILPVDDGTPGSANTIITFNGAATGGVTLAAGSVTTTLITLVEAGLELTKISVATNESGGTDSFGVNLLTAPSADVTVEITSSDTTEVTVWPASLTFTSSNWETIQTVTVTGVDDSEDDGVVSYTINLLTKTTDPIYNGISKMVIGTNADNNGPQVVALLGDVELLPSATDTRDASVAFSADDPDGVTYSAVSADPSVADVSVNAAGLVTVTAGGGADGGVTEVTVTKAEVAEGNLSAMQTFKVTVFKVAIASATKEVVYTGGDTLTATLTRGSSTTSLGGVSFAAFENNDEVAFETFTSSITNITSITNSQIIESIKGFTLLEDKVVDIDIFNEGTCTEAARCGVTLSYTQADLDELKVKDPGKDLIMLHYTGGVKGEWEALETSNVNTGSRTVTAFAFAFSPFVIAVKSSLTEEVVAQLNKAIMTRFTKALVASTVASVEKRVGVNFSGKPQAASYQFDGQTVQLDDQVTLSDSFNDTLQGKLPGYIKSLKDDTMDWKQMLSNSSFVLPLSVDDNDSGDAGLTIWGGGDYLKMSGKSEENDAKLDWKGSMLGLQLGVDGRVRDDLLVGGLLSLSNGDAEYTLDDVDGTYEHKMTSVHPYVAWSSGDTNVWGSAGYGKGKLAIKHGDDAEANADTRMLSLSAGIKGKLSQGPGLSIKGDVSLASTDIGNYTDADGNPNTALADSTLAGVKGVKSQRLRLVLESAQERTLSSGGKFTPVLEVGVRYDGGDGATGVGVVLGAGVRYANATGLTAEGKIHTLIGQKDYKEWGIQGSIRQAAGANGNGLSFSLSPNYGHKDGNADQVWNKKLPVGDANQTDDYQMQVKARLGYGMFNPNNDELFTPYSEVTLGDKSSYKLGLNWKRNSLSRKIYSKMDLDDKSRSYRLELGWKPNPSFDMTLSGGHKETNEGSVKRDVLLKAGIRF